MTLTTEQRLATLESEVKRLRRWVRVLTVLLVFVTGCLISQFVLAAEPLQAAIRDRSEFPTDDWSSLYYLDASASEDPERLASVGKFVVASTSRQPILDHCIPVRVAPSLYRIDLRDLKWDYQQWLEVIKDYPYGSLTATQVSDGIFRTKVLAVKEHVNGKFELVAEDGSRLATTEEYWTSAVIGHKYSSNRWVTLTYNSIPLVVRMDWLIVELTDTVESDSYYRLLYGKANFPKTRNEYLDFWEVTQRPDLAFGIIEGQSGVSKNKRRIRRIYNFAGYRGYGWKTEDYFEITLERDPLKLTYPGSHQPPHDGEETIVGVPKVSLATGQRCVLQVYLLSGGDGKKINSANVRLVEDKTKFRDYAEITTPGSCMQCHAVGLNPPTQNALRHLIQRGVDVYAYEKKQAEAIEAFWLTDVGVEIIRNNEDYAKGVFACNGLTPTENAAVFQEAVNEYDRNLGLEAASRELHCETTELQFALATYNKGITPPLIAGLVHGDKIPRSLWEQYYATAKLALKLWREK